MPDYRNYLIKKNIIVQNQFKDKQTNKDNLVLRNLIINLI